MKSEGPVDEIRLVYTKVKDIESPTFLHHCSSLLNSPTPEINDHLKWQLVISDITTCKGKYVYAKKWIKPPIICIHTSYFQL